ncbi:MAG: family 16 glycosylhydrolase [Lachnospiraceae bacterium]|nr:family 16 glycosylhydrolase [Lachnospiraceae bacterium]
MRTKQLTWAKKIFIALHAVIFALVLAGCGKESSLQKRVGTVVPPAFTESANEEKEVVKVKAKGFNYDKDNLTYELVWSDEFDYEGAPDPDKWTYQTGGSGWGNNELQYYTEDGNASVKEGHLSIELRKEKKESNEYTSARMNSKASWQYGRVEVKAKLPKGLGTWPAIWMMPDESVYGNWPNSGEIDIMEHVGYDQDNVFSTIHTESYNHRIGTQKGKTVHIEGVSEDYHVYTLEWLPDEMSMYVDDTHVFTFKPTDFKKEPTSAEWPYDRAFHLILNIAYGGNLGGAKGTDDSCLPASMDIDYVRVYQAKEFSGMKGEDKVSPSGKEFTMGDRFLKADGNIIRNAKGEEVLLQGVNLGGWFVTESWMCPSGTKDEKTLRATLKGRFEEEGMRELVKIYQDAWITESDFDLIKEVGYNCVRIPMYYGNFMDDEGNLIAGAFDKLDWAIEQAEKRDLYVVLDLHGAPGAQSDMDHCGEADGGHKLWKYESWQDMTVRLWECLATRYKNCDTVAMYDLLNEPDKVDKALLWKVYDRIYKAIRAIDPDHMISFEAAWDWGFLPEPSERNWENVVYQMHFYAMGSGEADSHEVQENLVKNKLRECREYADKWNVPVYVGEFNLFAFNDLWTDFIKGFQAEHIQWTNWTYKVSSNYGNWGLYNNAKLTAPSASNDSFDALKEKLAKYTSDNFNRNEEFINMLKDALN